MLAENVFRNNKFVKYKLGQNIVSYDGIMISI